MSARPRWRDAEQVAASLTNAERETLNTLISVPLAEIKLLQQLEALDGAAAVYRRIARLREAGLVAELRPPLQPGRGPGLLYLTDLGIAAISHLWRVDPPDLAGGFRVRGADLRRRLPGLAVLHACHRLLGALAVAGPGWPRLLAWEQPFRRRFRRPTAKALVRLTLPAYASLAWDDRADGYLLLPDLGMSQLRAYRPLLSRLDALRRATGDAPRLIVGTEDWRVDDWLELREAVARARGSSPVPAWIARWSSLETDLEALMDDHPPDTRETDPWIRSLGLRPFKPRRLDAPIPRLVGDLMAPATKAEPTMARLGRLVLTLKSSDYKLLEMVAHHPLLPPDRLAVVLRWETRRVRERIAGLRRHGLIRQLGPAEAGDVRAEDLWELTADGLRLVAARIGLPFPVAVRANGLAGGGPEEPIGRRRNLIRYLAHTRGADDVFVDLFRMADFFGEHGGDDELIEWQGPAACAHGLMRPDGYGEYRRAGEMYEFYLEYDRGTTSRRDYFEKFTSYYKHVERRRFERDYHGFPTVLVVTTSPAAEKRIAESLRTVSGGYPFELEALLTCEGLGVVSRYNPEGLLGPIWRDAWTTERRCWLPPSHGTSTEAPT